MDTGQELGIDEVGHQKEYYHHNWTMRSLVSFIWVLPLFGLTLSFTTPAPGTAETCGNLTEISEILWAAANLRSIQVVYGDAASQNDANAQADIILNLRPSQGGSLFQYVKWPDFDDSYTNMPTDFIPETLTPEPWTESRFYPIQEFSLRVSGTQVMTELGQYLVCRGLISYDNMFTEIFDWFSNYPRYPDGDNIYDSSAFENVFMGEFSSDGKNVLGLHNWYRFYQLENAGEVDLLGEIQLVDPNILAFPFCWLGRYQPQGSMFVGTSLEYEMAIYMLCFYEMPGEECNVSLGGRQVTVKTEVTDDYFPRLASAYPVVEVPQPSKTCYEVRSTTQPPPTTPPPDCGSLTNISEILWAADTSRLSFGDAMTLFPGLTEYTDSSIAQAISQADPNSLPDIILNYQNNQSNLFQYVNLNNDDSSYEEFLSIMKGSYYNPEPAQDDDFLYSNEQGRKLYEFFGYLLQTEPMKELTTYALCKGFVSSESELKDLLFSVWFIEYYRYTEGGGADSSGFENTFMGEYGWGGRGEEQNVVGLHNWFRLYALEVDGKMDYQSFIGRIEPNIQSFSFDWDDHHQPQSSVWMGSSLGFEMAIYSLCYFEKPSEDCHVSLGGHLVNVHVEISTYYDGRIFSAFPELTVLSPATTTTTTTSTSSASKTTTAPSPSPSSSTSSSSSSSSSQRTPRNCGSLTEISEIFWAADSRLNFSDVLTVFPHLTELTDSKIAEAISQTDIDSLPDILINLHASGENNANGIHSKLFQYVKPSQIGDSYNKLYELFLLYNPQPVEDETLTESKFSLIQDFINSITASRPIIELENYLRCRGFIEEWDTIWTLLWDTWFDDYARYPEGIGHDSSDSDVLGFHNWYRLYWQERAGEIDWPGYIGVVEPNILALLFCWSSHYQPQGSFFLGSSPEFEIAIYTLCFVEMPGLDCTVSLGGREVTIKTVQRVERQIDSAYPVVTVPQPSTTCADLRTTTTTTTTAPPACGSLTDISEMLWSADTSRLSFRSQQQPGPSADILLDYQNTDTKLFQFVNESKLTSETYKTFRTLMGSFRPNQFEDDWSTEERHLQILDFLDAVLSTEVMKKLTAYVLCKGFVGSEFDFKRLLDEIWTLGYYRYTEATGLDSSGFENTFLGELGAFQEEDQVSGLRNWYRLYLLEKSGNASYTGYIGQIQPNIFGLAFDWFDYHQPESTVWMGSSPEFEMAIYTLCYFEKPSEECYVSLGGHVVTVFVEVTQYYDNQIYSAYPKLTRPPTTMAPPSSSVSHTPVSTSTSSSTSTTTTTATTPTTTTTSGSPMTTTTTTTTTAALPIATTTFSSTTTTSTITSTSTTSRISSSPSSSSTTTTSIVTSSPTTTSTTTTAKPSTTTTTTHSPTTTIITPTTKTPTSAIPHSPTTASTTSAPTPTTAYSTSTTSTSTACPPGLYGWSCSETCSMFCGGDGTCDVISGVCAHGCDDGHVGLKCDAEKNGGQGRHVGIRMLALVLAAPMKVFYDRYQQLP